MTSDDPASVAPRPPRRIADMNKLDLLTGLEEFVRQSSTSEVSAVRKLTPYDLGRLLEYRRRVALPIPSDMDMIDLRLRLIPESVRRLEVFSDVLISQVHGAASRNYQRGYLTGAFFMLLLALAVVFSLWKVGVLHVG